MRANPFLCQVVVITGFDGQVTIVYQYPVADFKLVRFIEG